MVKTSICLAGILLILSCASTHKGSHIQFEESSVTQISKGMTISEFETLFGPPDVHYEAVFGKLTQKPWKALVYNYYMAPDPNYVFVKRNLTNTFVFSLEANPPKLNNWTIEYTHNQKSAE